MEYGPRGSWPCRRTTKPIRVRDRVQAPDPRGGANRWGESRYRAWSETACSSIRASRRAVVSATAAPHRAPGSRKGLATPQVQYRLHDWCISRQRYWGPRSRSSTATVAGPVGVPEQDLPVLLPLIEDFRPDATGVSPLARTKEWYYAKCPQCGAQGRRERTCRTHSSIRLGTTSATRRRVLTDRPWDAKRTKIWLPSPATSAGTSTPCSICCIPGSSTCPRGVWGTCTSRAFRQAPGGTGSSSRRREDVQVARQRGDSRLLHQQWGADTFRMSSCSSGPSRKAGDFRRDRDRRIRRFLTRCGPRRMRLRACPQAQSRGCPPTWRASCIRRSRKITADTEASDYKTRRSRR